MIKKHLFFFFLFLNLFAYGQDEKIILLTKDFGDFYSIATASYILEDKDYLVTLDHLVKKPSTLDFKRLTSHNTNLGFTTSCYWVKFKIHYLGDYEKEFYLEVARPITNLVELYSPDSKGDYSRKRSGDDILFSQKDVPHKNSLFKINLVPDQISTFYLRLGSDGEVINLPMKIWEPESMRQRDYTEQYLLGIYYGMLLFVFLIYLFFFIALNEKSFLFYILYVLSIFLFQFSIDGLTFQYFFPDNTWFANRSVLITACMTLIFLLKYAQTFLKTKSVLPGIHKVLTVVIYIGAVFLTISLFEGWIYTLAFPLVNVISLVGTLLIITTIIIARINKIRVCGFFITAFCFLVLGAVIFILNNLSLVPNSFITENGLKLGTGLEVIFLSFSMANRFRDLQKEKEKAQAKVMEKLEEMNQLKDQITVELEKQVKERTREINSQKDEIEEKNKDITDSIKYAKRIQEAILPGKEKFSEFFPDSFILYKPKDIVSGDFYWFNSFGQGGEKQFIVAAADCTGHGVPGAFMSMIGNSFLNEIVNEKNITRPNEILDLLRNGIIHSLKQKVEESENKDGMDIALINVDLKDMKLEFSGAQNPLYLIRNNVVEETKGDKFPIGVYAGSESNPFTNRIFELQKGDLVYIFTDGYADQFGGPRGKKFKYKQLQELLLSIQEMPMAEQKEILEETIAEWKGQLEQVDDILMIGIRI